MNKNSFRLFLCVAAMAVLVLFAPSVFAAEQVAKVTNFQGDAVIQSGTEFFPVSQVGQPVNDGDRIQTKNGKLEITFKDGAVTKVEPFTNGMIQQRNEKAGTWGFKS